MRRSVRTALLATLVNRILVTAVAVVSVSVLGIDSSNAETADRPALSQPFGETVDSIVAPVVRWDAVWYLSIANEGYWYGDPAEGKAVAREDSQRVAFFPLYPLAVHALSGGAASPAALVVAAFGLSLAAFGAALYLLRRLVLLEGFTERQADLSVWLLALFPGSYTFGAPYTESLFLFLTVAAFYAVRLGRPALGWIAAALAGATRSAGVLLAPALLAIADTRRRGLALAVAPVVGLAAYALYLWNATGSPRVARQDYWAREFAGPFGGLVEGAFAAVRGLTRLGTGSPVQQAYDADALMLIGFGAFALAATYGCVRRLPLAYGVFALGAVLLATSFPSEFQPLLSLPRLLGVVFPLFIWLALAVEGRSRLALSVSAIGLAVLTARYATWEMVG